MGQVVNLVGKGFGRLVVVSFAGLNSHRKAMWLCRCDCGKDATVLAASLRSGRQVSCGCLHSEGTNLTHGHTAGEKSPTYQTWQSMIARCTSTKNRGYSNYGGRGITVCERWQTFAGFFADMGEKPPGLTLDRIDNERGYEPGNCRWATRKEQATNRRTTKLNDVAHCLIRHMHRRGSNRRDIAHAFGVSWETVSRSMRGRSA